MDGAAPCLEPVTLLHRDRDLVVVSKPAGMFVHRTALGPDRDVLLQRVRDLVGGHVYPVHRLDRPASGVVVFGRSPEAARGLHAALARNDATKAYVGLARGRITHPRMLDRPLTNEARTATLAARTDVIPLSFAPLSCSLVLLLLRTGRRHQIRRHLAHAAHHLIGDVLYGKGRINHEFRTRFGLTRLALHALRLDLVHPSTGEPLRIEAPLPDDLRAPLSRMGLEPALRCYDSWLPR